MRVLCARPSRLSLTAHRTALLWRRAGRGRPHSALTRPPASPPPRPHNSLRLLLAQPLFIYRGGERRAQEEGGSGDLGATNDPPCGLIHEYVPRVDCALSV